jgi:tetraacyldisaccharide 4'-kinase
MNGAVTATASLLWSTVNWGVRRFGQGERARLGAARVISVGNIQAGGAGKTPLVARIAREGAERGLRVCVLSRGYRGEWERGQGVLAPGEPAPLARVSGDEPALLRELAPAAWIGIGSDRVASFEAVAKKAGKIDLAILDDGFQNRSIAKDLEIVALTSAKPSQKVFRDFQGELERADLLIWTKGGERPLFPNGKPLVRAEFKIEKAASASPFFLVTGIEDGESAVLTARAAGYRIEKHVALGDHHVYSESEIRGLIETARAAGLKIALTGKDWVKWRDHGIDRREVEVLEPRLELGAEDLKTWDRVVWAG